MSRDFMADLEARVNEAAARYRRAHAREPPVGRRSSRSSAPRFTASAATTAGEGARSRPAEKAWMKERDEIRRRLETLIARLEALLR